MFSRKIRLATMISLVLVLAAIFIGRLTHHVDWNINVVVLVAVAVSAIVHMPAEARPYTSLRSTAVDRATATVARVGHTLRGSDRSSSFSVWTLLVRMDYGPYRVLPDTTRRAGFGLLQEGDTLEIETGWNATTGDLELRSCNLFPDKRASRFDVDPGKHMPARIVRLAEGIIIGERGSCTEYYLVVEVDSEQQTGSKKWVALRGLAQEFPDLPLVRIGDLVDFKCDMNEAGDAALTRFSCLFRSSVENTSPFKS